MRVKIENLGAVKKADIELGNLTIIAGENTTGKTNIVYTIWDVLRDPGQYLKVNLSNKFIQKYFRNLSKIFEENINKYGIINQEPIVIKAPIDDSLNKKVEKYVVDYKKTYKNISNALARIVPEPDNEIQPLKINLVMDNDSKQILIDNIYEEKSFCKVHLTVENKLYKESNTTEQQQFFPLEKILPINLDYTLTITQDENELQCSFEFDGMRKNYSRFIGKILKVHFKSDISQYISDFIISNNIIHNNIEIATSDRAGVISFIRENQKEMRYGARNSVLNNVSMNDRYMIHALPVLKNMDFISDLPTIIDQRRKISKTENSISLENEYLKSAYEEIEKMMGGSLRITQMGEVYFKEFGTEADEKAGIKFNNLSSSIKSLTMIYFQLKYSLNLYEKGSYYIIDEPESFLHPANQTQMARIIAMMINAGLKVIITTHSDYIIRELNALISIGHLKLTPDQKKYFDKHTNLTEIKKEMLLKNKDIIKVYFIDKEGNSHQSEVTKTGVDVKSFDTAIFKQQDLFNSISQFIIK